MFTPGRYRSYVFLLLISGLAAACSSNIKPYPNTLDKNLHVKTNASITTAVDVFKVNPDCSIKYSGTVNLNKPEIDIGIPADRSSYLAFVFSESGLFSDSSTTSFETLLRPRANHIYDIDVSYQENIYNVLIHEKRKGSTKSREIETKGLAACNPL